MQVQQNQFQLQNGVATSNNNSQVLLVNLPEKPSRRKYYPVCQSIFLGFLQILLGAGSIIIAGLMIENQTTPWFVGHGFWCGALAFISGCFSVGAGCSKSKCPIVCSLVFSIFGVLFIGFQIGIAIYSAVFYGVLIYQIYPYYYNYPLTSSTTASLHSSTTSSTFLTTDSTFTNYQQVVISIILASFGALMWLLACWMSCIGCHFSCCYCCSGCCCPCYSPRVTRIRTQQTMMVQVPPNTNQPILNAYQPAPTFQQPNPMNQPVQPNYPAQQYQPNYPLQHFQPNQQFVQPNQPFVRPNQQFVQPNQPFVQPNQPFVQPNQPFVQPNQQFVQPNQPFVQPNQQFVQPNQPFVQPNQPFVQPNQPDRPVQPVQPFQLSDPHTYTHLQQNPTNYEPLIRDNEQTLNRNKIVSQSPPEYFEINNSVCYSEDRSQSNLRLQHDHLYDELESVESSGRDPTSPENLGVMDGSRDRTQHDDDRAEPQYQDCDAQGRYEATLNYNNSPAGTDNSYYLN